jgi:GT2 family glycosyltransferase
LNDLTISLVNTNNRELLRDCLRSIYRNTRRISFEIYVVDNVSTDGSVEMVRAEFPQVKLICNESRLPYSGNHNQVLQQPVGRYVLLLNEDTIVGPEALDGMVRFMDEHPEAGAMGCKMLYPDGSLQPSCARFPTFGTALAEAVFLDHLFPCWSETGLFMRCLDPEVVHEVDFVTGACLMLRNKALEEVGGLDARLVSFEEVDWCYRARGQGWKVYYSPCGQVVHLIGKTIGALWGERKVAMQLRDQFYFFQKHYGWTSVQLLRVIILLRSALRIAILVCSYPFTRERRMLSRCQIARNITRIKTSVSTN